MKIKTKTNYSSNKKKDNDKQLKQIQETELEILDVVDQFCKTYDICYSLTYGTLIGAVRHQGFIPWDDDIDLMMTRDAYDRFIRLWQKNPPSGFFLQTDVTDPPYGNNFLKIRKNGTTFIQCEMEKTISYHTGLFIDIFPVDRVAPVGWKRIMQNAACQINMLLTRDYSSGRRGIYGIVEKMLLALPCSWKRKIKTNSYKFKTRWNDNKNNHLPLFWNGTVYGMHQYFAGDLFDNMTELPFEGKKYPVYAQYDQFLSGYYGDYMTLPPENMRVTHNPLIVDFEHEYNDYTRRYNA